MLAELKNIRSLVILSALLMTSGSAIAVEGDLASDIPQASSENTVPVYSGGIGDDEINYIKTVQHEYNTKLLFTEANGEYLSDLPVSVRNKHGDVVLSTVTNGPVLLVNLPQGGYTVSATQNGISREQKISVIGHTMHEYQFRFPSNDAAQLSQ